MNSNPLLDVRTVIICIVMLSSCEQQKSIKDQDDFPILKGPYLGQEPVGETPEVFAPGIVSTMLHEHSFLAISPDGNQLLWSSYFRDDGGFPHKVIESSISNGVWSEPDFFEAIALEESIEPFFSFDGSRIYFSSESNGIDEKGFGDLDIWYIEKTGSDWTSPKNLGSNVNTLNHQFSPTLTKDLTLYFTGYFDRGAWNLGIFRSRLIDGVYEVPELLTEGIINTTDYADWTPFISPDESYLLFASMRPGGYGDDDIYISYRNSDDSWTAPLNLGPSVNTPYQDRYPSISPDGKYLFFISNEPDAELEGSHSMKFYKNKVLEHGNNWNDMYWIDASFIEELRPKN